VQLIPAHASVSFGEHLTLVGQLMCQDSQGWVWAPPALEHR
jgi:hypothetical protein